MALPVIGIFDKASGAQQAVEKLVDAGIMRQNIVLPLQSGLTADFGNTVPDRPINTSGTRSEEMADGDKDTGSSIVNFFSSLFVNDDDADRYTKATERDSLVMVHAQTVDEAKKAAHILDEAGAIDVHKQTPVYDSLTSQPSASMELHSPIRSRRMAIKPIKSLNKTWT